MFRTLMHVPYSLFRTHYGTKTLFVHSCVSRRSFEEGYHYRALSIAHPVTERLSSWVCVCVCVGERTCVYSDMARSCCFNVRSVRALVLMFCFGNFIIAMIIQCGSWFVYFQVWWVSSHLCDMMCCSVLQCVAVCCSISQWFWWSSSVHWCA